MRELVRALFCPDSSGLQAGLVRPVESADKSAHSILHSVHRVVASPDQMRALGAELGRSWKAGDVVLLDGPLGAGKTTLVRGLLESLGVKEPVRSPTYNLLQGFDTDPPVLHADLYRVKSEAGIGIEDYLETHLCLIEWPDRAPGLVRPDEAWHVKIEFVPEGRAVTIVPPAAQ